MMQRLERGPMLVAIGMLAIAFSVAEAAAQTPPTVRVDAPVVALNHVAVIDGTGAEAVQDQTVLLRDGTIEAHRSQDHIQYGLLVVRLNLALR